MRNDPRIINLRHYRRGRPFRIFDLPPDAIRIDRSSEWGNPYVIGRETVTAEVVDRLRAIELYRAYLRRRLHFDRAWLEPLRGKRLACWCAPARCHGELILEVLDMGVDAWLAAA